MPLTFAPTPLVNPDPISSAINTTSTAYKERETERKLVRDVLGGTKIMRRCASVYLPMYPRESEDGYKHRCATAVLTNVLKDAVDNCVSRPFARPVQFNEGLPEDVKGWLDDIDMEGSNISQFARGAFNDGVADGLVHILVDHTNAPGAQTLRDQQKAGVRPYLVHVPTRHLLAAYQEIVDGTPFITHARIASSELRLNGYTEEIITVIRVYSPYQCEVWESAPGVAGGAFSLVETLTRPWPHVPLYTFYAGRPEAPFVIDPPFLDLAHMNVKHFQVQSAYDNNLDKCNFAMLSVNPAGDANAPIESLKTATNDPVGMEKRLEVGPTTVLVGDWKYVEPNVAGLTETQRYLDKMIEHMRLMGLDPLQPKPMGGETATASALNESKAQSTLVDWTVKFADVLDKALSFAAMWGNKPVEFKVTINSDFALILDSQDIAALQSMRSTGDLSRHTLWEESKRRGVLGPKFDADEEAARIEEEGPSLGVLGVTGPLIAGANAQDDANEQAEADRKAAADAARKAA